MGATFPNGIASFKQHRNLLDDVDAGDINRLQDEIVAVQETIGALVTEVHTVETSVQQVLTDEAALEQGLAANQLADQLQQQQTTQQFASMKDRLDYIEQGRHMYAFEGYGGPYVLAPVGRYADSKTLGLVTPAGGHDPKGMFNGVGFTLTKTGFWVINGHVRYDVDLTKGTKNAGMYQATIAVGGQDHRGIDRAAPINDDGWLNVMLNPVAFGWFPAGTTVYLRSKQTTSINQSITTAIFAGYMLREF